MIAQHKKYSRKLTFLAFSLLISICFIFFTSAQGLSIEGTAKTEGRLQLSPTMQPILDIAASPETGNARQAEREKAPILPTEAQKAIYKAQLMMDKEKWDEAIARIDEYLATQPPDVPAAAYMMLGNCWWNKENIEESRKAFEKAYEIDPIDPIVLRNYTSMTYQAERFLDAAALFEKLFDIEDPAKPKTLWHAANAYYQAEDLKNSKRVMERLMRIPGTPDPQWYPLIIEVSYAMEQWADVERYVQEFLRLNPVQAYYWQLLSQIQLDKNDLLSGARSLEMAYRIQPPKNKNGWRTLAEIYHSIGETEKAAHYYEKAGVTKEEVERNLEEEKSLSWEETSDTAGFEINMDEFGFDVTQVDKPPSYLQRFFPVYPLSAKLQGIKARVKIKCLVDKEGIPEHIIATECEPEDALDVFGPPAVEAVKKWRFIPGEIGGNPVPTRVAFWIVFELPDSPYEVNS